MNSPRHGTPRPTGPVGTTTATDTEAGRISPGATAGSATGDSRTAAGAAGHTIEETLEGVRQSAEGTAEDHKGAIAEMVADCAHALEAAAGELTRRNQPQAAEYVNSVSSAVGHMRRAIDTKSPGDMVNDVSAFAREHPAAFLGGGLLIGMALGRLGKASAKRHHEVAVAGGAEYASMRPAEAPATRPSDIRNGPTQRHWHSVSSSGRRCRRRRSRTDNSERPPKRSGSPRA